MSYVGVHVALGLHDGNTLTGIIREIDADRNVIVLSRTGTASKGKRLSIERSKIKSITLAPEPASSSEGASAGVQSDPADKAPDASKLPKPGGSGSRGGKDQGKKANKSKGKKNNAAQAATNAATAAVAVGQPSAPTPPVSMSEDFDFEASLRSFDKAKIWDEIRAADRTDPSGRLVAHNRLTPIAAAGASSSDLSLGRSSSPAPGQQYGGKSNDKMRKLRPDENVLSPSPPSSPELPAVGPTNQPASSMGSDEVALQSDRDTLSNGESTSLQAQIALLQRRLQIMETLTGLRTSPSSATSTGKKPVLPTDPLELDCSFSPTVLPATGSASTGPASTMHFQLLSTLDKRDGRLRFKPGQKVGAGSTAATGTAAQGVDVDLSSLPEKYRRELGLRLDNGSASVFFERLRAAATSS
ncbi:unnamed protein product [Jaminaea pallidilutea]